MRNKNRILSQNTWLSSPTIFCFNLVGHPIFESQTDITITGHSLGGTLRTLVAFFLAYDKTVINRRWKHEGNIAHRYISCISFASPLVGKYCSQKAFKVLEESVSFKHVRITNGRDFFLLCLLCRLIGTLEYTCISVVKTGSEYSKMPKSRTLATLINHRIIYWVYAYDPCVLNVATVLAFVLYSVFSCNLQNSNHSL